MFHKLCSIISCIFLILSIVAWLGDTLSLEDTYLAVVSVFFLIAPKYLWLGDKKVTYNRP